MAPSFDWRSDPIVKVESKVEHCVALGAMWLTDVLLAPKAIDSETFEALNTYFEAAVECLDAAAKPLFAPMNIETPSEVVLLCHQAAEACRTALVMFKSVAATPEPAPIAKASDFLRTTLTPKIQAALDGLRGTFITTVLQRQTVQRTQADQAIKQVQDISKKIFFISINASVEAARVGDAGRGFSMISQEIRSLSQTAKVAVDDLSSATQ